MTTTKKKSSWSLAEPTQTPFGALLLHYNVPVFPLPLAHAQDLDPDQTLSERDLEEEFSIRLKEHDEVVVEKIKGCEPAWRKTLEAWALEANVHYIPSLDRYTVLK